MFHQKSHLGSLARTQPSTQCRESVIDEQDGLALVCGPGNFQEGRKRKMKGNRAVAAKDKTDKQRQMSTGRVSVSPHYSDGFYIIPVPQPGWKTRHCITRLGHTDHLHLLAH